MNNTIFPFLTSIFIGFFLISCNNTNYYEKYSLKDGKLDLNNFDFKKNNYLLLKGEVEFYWKQLLTPEDFIGTNNKKVFVTIPSDWRNYKIENHNLDSFGYATYRFKIRISDLELYALKILNFSTSFKIFIDGKLLLEGGKVADNRKDCIPEEKPYFITFMPDDKEIDFIIQVANFHHRQGGFWEYVKFGKAEQLKKSVKYEVIIELLIIGFILFIALYHLILFILNKNLLYLLYFSITNLFQLIRLATTGEHIIYDFIPFFHNNYELLKKISVISYLFAAIFSMIVIIEVLDFNKRKIINLIIFSYTIYSIVLLILPYHTGFMILNLGHFITVLLSVYTIILVIINLKKDMLFSFLCLFGYSISFIFAVHDILYSLFIIMSYGFLASYGMISLNIIQAFALSYKYNLTFKDIRKLKDELVIKNRELKDWGTKLEENVKLRTNELSLTNEKLIKVNSLKDKLFSIISHDLKDSFGSFKYYMEYIHFLYETNDKEKIEESFYLTKRSLDNIYQLLDNLLSWARTQQKSYIFDPDNYSINIMLADILNYFGPIAKGKNIKIITTFNEELTGYFDKNQIFTVFRNIISNAIKFSKENSDILIHGNVIEHFNKIVIEDFGVGIGNDRLEYLFDDTTNISTVGTNNEKGTGIGLKIAKEFMTINNGKIEVESFLGMGTKFYILIPLKNENL